MKYIFTFLFVFCLAFSPYHAFAGSTKDLELQIEELKRVNEAQARNLATALNQLQEVLTEFQKLNGQVDQNAHFSEQQSKVIQDSQRRMQIVEEKVQLLGTQLEEIKAAGLLKESQSKQLSEFKAYQIQLSKVNAEQYRDAITGLKSFISIHPKSIYASYAQYWVGESYYAMRDFPASVSEFQKAIKSYPKSSKAAASLLKQGYAFFEMQSFGDARAFLSKLVSQFPVSPEAVLASQRIREIDRLLEQKEKQAIENKMVM